MPQSSRRDFIRFATAASLGFVGVRHLLAAGASRGAGLSGAGLSGAGFAAPGFGPLVSDPAGVLDLPAGFRYKVISRVGTTMSDGLIVPGSPDGMAAFAADDGRTLLIRNHEIGVEPGVVGPYGAAGEHLARVPDAKFYDRGTPDAPTPALGGTTTLVYDTRTQTLERESLSLAGTMRNCAGGATPWGTWLTCEEDVTPAGGGFRKSHGWVFEVPASAEAALAEPRPIEGMGRFNHEAVCVDPRTGIVYLTEDRGDGLVYRFVPNAKPEKAGDLHAGGRLEALVVRGKPSFDTRNRKTADVLPGQTLECEWLPLSGIESPEDDLRFRGFDAGAARFARGEGIVWAADGAYIVCTDGGASRRGQLWKYRPSMHEGTPGEREKPATLTLFVEPNDRDVLDMPDNIGVAPWGDLVLCEDGGGEQFLVGVTPEGGLYKLARNATGESEFAGATFSPDGSTLFVNVQYSGLTLAITGPWGRG